MPEYRTPEEAQAQQAREARVRAVLDQAVADGVSCLVAIALGEPAGVVELWIDRFWDGLRDNLSDQHPDRILGDGSSAPEEDRLTAISLLLADRIHAGAEQLLAPDGGEPR